MELCKNCNAGCCRRYLRPIWGSDIIRICETLNVDMFFFITVIKEEKGKELRGKEPVFYFTDAGEEMYFSIWLKSNLSRFYPEVTKCMFLQEWSAEAQQSEELTGVIGRCGIYDIRPINCRVWPAEYSAKDDKVLIKDPYTDLEHKPDKATDSEGYSLCPKPLTKEDYSRFEEQYYKDALINHHEWQFFIKVSEKWNQNPDVSDKFYDFLKQEYSNRLYPTQNNKRS